MARAGVQLTEEQAAIRDHFWIGDDVRVIAGAGTGKTTLLRELGRSVPAQSGLYLAYNTTVASEASASFPPSVRCVTAHALAMSAIGWRYRHRLATGRQPAAEAARLLGIAGPHRVSKNRVLAPAQIARLARDTVRQFCLSADDDLTEQHVICQPPLNVPEVAPNVRRLVLPWARKLWADATSFDGVQLFSHDHYMKMWALGHPVLNDHDFLFFDEAQDAWDCVAQVVRDQRNHLQVVVVGDQAQAIYGWRGAVDSLQSFDGVELPLSQSWRFGNAVANEANKWLMLMGASMRLTGNRAIQSDVGPLPFPAQAVLCRTNAGAIGEVMAALADGHMVALHGKGAANSIKRLAEAAIELKRGEGTSHPDLWAFKTWGELQLFCEEEGAAAADLRVFVELIDQHGPEIVIETMGALCEESDVLRQVKGGGVGVIVSTAHRAKGGEWSTVRIAGDFFRPDFDKPLPEAELRLAYVAVTRAIHALDLGGLGWINLWMKMLEQRAPVQRVAVT